MVCVQVHMSCGRGWSRLTCLSDRQALELTVAGLELTVAGQELLVHQEGSPASLAGRPEACGKAELSDSDW